MQRAFGWSAAACVVALLLWQLTSSEPLLPPLLSGLLLLTVGALAGMRIAADSAAAYIRDLQRLNKTLADQHREIEETNRVLLKQVSDHLEAPS